MAKTIYVNAKWASGNPVQIDGIEYTVDALSGSIAFSSISEAMSNGSVVSGDTVYVYNADLSVMAADTPPPEGIFNIPGTTISIAPLGNDFFLTFSAARFELNNNTFVLKKTGEGAGAPSVLFDFSKTKLETFSNQKTHQFKLYDSTGTKAQLKLENAILKLRKGFDANESITIQGKINLTNHAFLLLDTALKGERTYADISITGSTLTIGTYGSKEYSVSAAGESATISLHGLLNGTEYTVTYGTVTQTLTAANGTLTVAGLTQGSDYAFTVEGYFSNAKITKVYDDPTKTTDNNGKQTFSVDGLISGMKYRVTAIKNGSTTIAKTADVTATVDDNNNIVLTISGLAKNQNYTFSVNGYYEENKITEHYQLTPDTATSKITLSCGLKAPAPYSYVVTANGETVSTDPDTASTSGSKLDINGSFSAGTTYDVFVTGVFVDSSITNQGTITVDADSKITVDTILNQGGSIYLTYKRGCTDYITVSNPINNSVYNSIQGTITIDISALQPDEFGNYGEMKIADFIVADGQDGTIHLVRGPNVVTDVDFEVRRNQTDPTKNGIFIKATPTEPPKYLFVNAAWKDTHPSSTISYNNATVSLTFAGANRNAFYNIQDAVDAAKAYAEAYGTDCPIVFYKMSSGSSFDFLDQGTITVNTNVTFETNVSAGDITAVKMDSLHINAGSIATFKNGLYSMEDYIDNGGTLQIFENTKFNANMIGNESGTILVDTTSRIVSDAIEEGDIQLKLIEAKNNKKINGTDPWIIRPVGSIVDDAEIDIDTPSGSRFSYVRSGDKLVRDGDGVYYIQRVGGTPVAASAAIVWECMNQYRGLYLVNDVFNLRKVGGEGDDKDQYWSNTIYVDPGTAKGGSEAFDGHSAGDYFTFTTEGNKTVKAKYATGTETTNPAGYVYAFNSFVSAYNSTYTSKHKIGQTNEGIVIRLRKGSYSEYGSQLGNGTNNVIVEPDKSNGTTYDNVTLKLDGMNNGMSALLMEFSHLESLTIGGDGDSTKYLDTTRNWVFGSNAINGKKETGVLSFVDIGTLTINGTLKSEGGATARIINCADVISNKHLSVVGGTLIIDSSNITLAGAHSDLGKTEEARTKHGALSTENNAEGAGNVIVRNSTFKIDGTDINKGLFVNLKDDAEFMITGICTVNGIFTSEKNPAASKTTIAFSNATLDENTQILANTNSGYGSAALRFEGYNTLDGSRVEQAGNRNMTVEAGATVNMDNGATISISGGTVSVKNCGNISLDNNSSISAGSFDNTGSLTLTNGSTVNLGMGTGQFVNGENGTLTVDLQGDGSIGIAAGSIINHGLIQIDLSHTDYPADALTIDLTGLDSSDGEVRVIGGGGEVHSGGPTGLYVQLNVPPMQTLYVNGEWNHDPDSPWAKGKNVGSRMYYGYNSFKDNPGTGIDYLTFAGDTDKVVYVGGNATAYGDLSIPNNIVRTITATDSGVTFTRCSEMDSEDSGYTYYAWRNIDGEGKITVVYTQTIDVVKNETVIFIKEDDGFVHNDNDVVDALTCLSDLTLTTMAGSTGATAAMGSLTVGATQEVTLSGANISMGNININATTDPAASGTLNVGTGESAKLTFDVAKSNVTRDVKVKISAGGKEEYHTISVPAETNSTTANSTVVVKSDSLIAGQSYNVEVTDMHQCSYENSKLTVAVKQEATPRSVNITVRNASGVKYTYTNYAISEGASSVELTSPSFGSIAIVKGDTNKFELGYTSSTGQLELRAKSTSASAITLDADTTVQVQGTSTDGKCQFNYSYVVKKGSYGAGGMIDNTVNANFGTGYYYVEVKEAAISAGAAVDSISGSVVTAQDVTNDGTLTVASKNASGNSSAKLVLDVDKNNVDRWITVTVTEDAVSTDYSMYVAANESKAVLASENFNVGKSYKNVKISDGFTRTITAVSNDSQVSLVIDGLVADPDSRKFTVKYGSFNVDLTGSSTVYTTDTETGKTTATISGVSGIIADHEYTVTVEDVRTVSTVAQTLAEFTANAVTNTGTIAVTDATFTAASVAMNDGSFSVSGYSTLKIGSLDGEIKTASNTTLNNSTITGGATTGGTITAQNALTFTGANTLNSVTLTATGKTVTNSGSLTVNAASLITANNIDNTNGTPDDLSDDGTITVKADGVNWDTEENEGFTGFRKVIDVDTDSLANVSLAEDAPANVHLVQLAGSGDVYIGNEDQSTIYVGSAYTAVGSIADGHLVGYNAFSSLRDPALSYKATGVGQDVTAAAVNAENLVLTGQITNGRTLFYTDQPTVTITTGVTGATFTERLYLMHKIIYEKQEDDSFVVYGKDGVTPIADATLPVFILAEGAKLNGGSMLKVGESLDESDYDTGTGEFTRTAGAVKLTVNGDIKSFIQVNPYSSATVSKTGSVISEYNGSGVTQDEDQQCTYIRVNGTLTVNGDADAEDKPVQFKMQRLTFTDGGTLALNNTSAQFSRIRFYDEGFTIPTAKATITVTNSIVDKFAAGKNNNNNLDNIVGGYNFFVYGASEEKAVTNPSEQTVVLTLDNSVMNVSDKAVFNPNANTTVTIKSSTLNANTITNAGEITMDISNNGTASKLYANTITNDGTITMNNDSILIANSITNNATFQVKNSTRAGELSGSYYENHDKLELNGSIFNYKIVNNESTGKIEITDSTFTVTTTLTNSGSITLEGTSSDQNVSTLSIKEMSNGSNAILVADYVTLENSTVGYEGLAGTVKVQSGAILTLNGENTITTLDLSEETENETAKATMDSQDRLRFTGFGSSYANKFTIDMSNYSYSGDGEGYLLLDSANNNWTEEMYQELLTNVWNPANVSYKFVVKHGDLYAMDHFIVATVAVGGDDDDAYAMDADAKAHPNDQNYDFGTIDGATSVIPDKIVVTGGDFTSTASSLKGIESIIEAGEFRSVMGGKSVSSSGSDTITTGDISLTVQSGTFQKLVVAGDCSNAGTTIRCKDYDDDGGAGITYDKCDIEFNISGGVFSNPVVGGMAYMGEDDDTGMAALYGDVNLNITGGSFTSYLYGGSIARSKLVSGRTNINGNVTITVDAGSTPRTTTEKIVLNKVACGSYNTGTIMGSTKLVMTGLGENIVFLSSGEIWGGCGDDYYKANDERTFVTKVSGTRTLSFTGFNGELNSNCEKIRGFSHIEFVDRTWDAKTGTWTVYEYGDANSNEYGCKVELDTAGTGNYNLSDMKFWTFGENSSLSGKFKNDFKGDTLRLNGFAGSGSQTLISTATDNASIVFNSFGGVDGEGTNSSITFAEIQMGTWDATNKLWTYETVNAVFHEAANAWTWGDAYTGAYTLGLQTDDLGTTSLILSRS